MLTNIRLKNFKCFESLSLPLAPLTLLTGFNASGKSTTLQSILLLAQSLRSGNRSDGLPLNGSLVRLGTPGEVLNSGDGDIVFAVEDNQVEIEWALQAEDRSKGSALRIGRIQTRNATEAKEYSHIERLESLLPPEVGLDAKSLIDKIRETIFLSAVRQGTAEVFPSPEDPSPVHADVGVQGELAPWWFQLLLDDEIDGARCNPADQANSLRRQFNSWANELFPGAQGNAQAVERTNLMRLELRIGDVGDWRRPSNIGYGLTYAFPVIVAGLLAKKGQLLIIDSPEAHLHPLGQSQMGYFLAQIAAAGVQVVIETHSDHILNGIRRAIGERRILNKDQAIVHFFNANAINPLSLSFTETGSINSWPKGFFDQYQLDVTALTKVRRPR